MPKLAGLTDNKAILVTGKGWKYPVCLPEKKTWTKNSEGKLQFEEEYGRIFHLVSCKLKDSLVKFERNASGECKKFEKKDQGNPI